MPRKPQPKPVPAPQPSNSIWENFTEREMDEIRLATLYSRSFAHGTDGHNRLMLIAKLAYTVADLMGQVEDDTVSLDSLIEKELTNES